MELIILPEMAYDLGRTLSQPDVSRSPGIHVSDLIASMEEELGTSGRRKGPSGRDRNVVVEEMEGKRMEDSIVSSSLLDPLSPPHSPLPLPLILDPSAWYFAQGLIWERAVIRSITTSILLGPVERDGIVCTVDAFDYASGEPIECKATWKSMRHPPTDIWRWMVQTKAYCAVTGALSCRLYVQYLCGDWSPPVPCGKVFRLQFTAQEIQENWQMLLNYLPRYAYLEKRGERGKAEDIGRVVDY